MLVQFFANSLVAGAGFTLVALSLGLTCNSSGFFNLSYAGIYGLAAYLVLAFTTLGLPFPLALLLAAFLAFSLAVVLEALIFRPLRTQHASEEILLLASLGLLIMLQNAISLAWGDRTQSLSLGAVEPGLIVVGARLTPIQILIILSAFLVAVALGSWLRWTRSGKQLRAIGSNRRLATTAGLKVHLWTALGAGIGSAMGAVAATLQALDTDLTPSMGFNAMLTGLVALILGGMTSIPRIILASLGLGFVYQLAAWYLPGQWQQGVAMITLLLVLWRQPQSPLTWQAKGES